MRYDEFYKAVEANEGGYQNDPDDKGNAGKGTIYGIAYKYFPYDFLACYSLYKQGKIKEAKEYAKKFYYNKFYNPLYDKIHNEQLAFKIFDLSVNLGKTTTIKLLQTALNKYGDLRIADDGVFGDYTLKAVNYAPDDFYNRFIMLVEEHYERKAKLGRNKKFLFGWLNRLKKIFKGE